MTTLNTLKELNIPTSSVNRAVQAISTMLESGTKISKLTTALGLKFPTVDNTIATKYAVVHIIQNPDASIEEVNEKAVQSTKDYLLKFGKDKTQPIVLKKERKTNDLREQAKNLYNQYLSLKGDDEMTNAQIVNKIAEDLKISVANSRYYVMVFQGKR